MIWLRLHVLAGFLGPGVRKRPALRVSGAFCRFVGVCLMFRVLGLRLLIGFGDQYSVLRVLSVLGLLVLPGCATMWISDAATSATVACDFLSLRFCSGFSFDNCWQRPSVIARLFLFVLWVRQLLSFRVLQRLGLQTLGLGVYFQLPYGGRFRLGSWRI